nr:MAG TPA: hypothetical protein [Caudoviricetes sp.]
MREYIEKLRERLHELMERPVTLGNVEEVRLYAKTIRALEKLECGETFTKEDALYWVEHMENSDGTTGAQWTMDETSAMAKSMGVYLPACIWYAAVNMMRSDYCMVARKHGVDKPEFYADMAQAFLFDKDAGEPEEKISAYYHCVAGKEK